jgi:hypothetical protein
VIRLLYDGLRGKQGVTNDKIRQIGMVHRRRPQEQRFFLSPNSQGDPVFILNCYSRHDTYK